jgi:DNA topoisomerase-2
VTYERNFIRKERYYLRLIKKEHLLVKLTAKLDKLENRVRFVTEIIDGKLKVQNRKKVDIVQDLKKRGYHAILKSGVVEDEEEADTTGNNHGYDYLMSMPIWSLTMEKVGFHLRNRFKPY